MRQYNMDPYQPMFGVYGLWQKHLVNMTIVNEKLHFLYFLSIAEEVCVVKLQHRYFS